MQVTPRERLITWDDPFANFPKVAGLTGLETLQSMLRGELFPPPIASLMNMTLVEVEEGRAVFEGTPGEEHYNPIGSVHGGFALTLLDSALGCAVHAGLPAFATYGTIDVQARLVRPISKDTGRVRCEGKLISLTTSIATAEARLTDMSGKLLATGTTACFIKRPSAPKSSS